MMHKLTFKPSKKLKSLARETLFAKEFKIAYRDKTTKERSFWLVKDEGIYVMNCYLKEKLNMLSMLVDTIPSMTSMMTYGIGHTKSVAMTLQKISH